MRGGAGEETWENNADEVKGEVPRLCILGEKVWAAIGWHKRRTSRDE